MENEVRVAIGVRLKQSRKAARLSQAEVAQEFKVARQLVSGWECGRGSPTLRQWYALAPLYGVSLDYLVYGVRTTPVSLSGVLERVFQSPGVKPRVVAFGTPERPLAF